VLPPAAAQVFVKGLLEKFKVQPEVFRREEYKVNTAASSIHTQMLS
jgi:hypothetical protein